MQKIDSILHRLRSEIRLYEQFESNFELVQSLTKLSLKELLTNTFLSNPSSSIPWLTAFYSSLYDEWFRRYPIIQTKIKKELFQSWLILNNEEKLLSLLKIKLNYE